VSLLLRNPYWFPMIPEGWRCISAKRVLKISKEIPAAGTSDRYQRLSLTMNGVLPKSRESNVGLQPANFDGYQLVRPNELVFKLIDLKNISTSRVGISKDLGLVSPAYIVAGVSKEIYPRFAYYYFLNLYYQRVFNQLGGDGVRSALNADDLGNIPIVLPPLEVQKAIADYLDREVKILESAKASQEELIEFLVERRLATIQAAIQDSTHFSDSVFTPLKWRAKFRTGGTPTDAQFTTEPTDGVPWLRPDDLDESGNPSRGTRFFNKSSLVGIGMAKPGSILLCCIGATLGKAGIVSENVAFNQQITSITSSLNPRYLYYQLVARKQDLINLSVGNTLPILNNDRLGTLKIVIPTAENQASMVRSLDLQIGSMDTAIQKARDLIAVLAERREAVVNGAVTGEIGVRGKTNG
jgi:type I restriction enzyme S subunit